MIQYNPYLSSQFSTVLNTNNVRSLELSLRDQNDILIQFNEASFELSLLFEIHSKGNGPTIPAPLIESTSGGRRSEFTDFIPTQQNQPQVSQETQQTRNQQQIHNNITRRDLFKSSDLTNFKVPGIQNKVVNQSQIGYTGTITKPKSTAVLPMINEDTALNMKQESILQDKLLELSLLDEIL